MTNLYATATMTGTYGSRSAPLSGNAMPSMKCDNSRTREKILLTPASSPAYWGCFSLFAFCCCLLFACPSESLLSFVLPVREAVAESAIYEGKRFQGGLFQRIKEKHGSISAEYGFHNFNNDSLKVSFSISAKDFSSYRSGYGYTPAELEELMAWQKNALNAAYKSSLGRDAPTRAQLDNLYEAIRNSYQEKYRALLESRGFAFRGNNVISVNMPGIVKRNIKPVRSIAAELAKQGAVLDYGPDEVVGAALSLVQTALKFENVPAEINGRRIGGLYPPVEALVKGKADCDSKSALLASILLNWDKVKLIGIVTPSHYLIGILRNPAKGEAFVEYKGLQYVLLEPAGPAWLPPGLIGPETEEAITAGQGVRIEALTGT